MCDNPWYPLEEMWNNPPEPKDFVNDRVRLNYETGVLPVGEPDIKLAKVGGFFNVLGDIVAFGLSMAGTTAQVVVGPEGASAVHGAYELSPVGVIENYSSIIAYFGTLVSDIAIGNTALYPGGGVQIGQDTYVSAVGSSLGAVPLGPMYDQVINTEILAYDINSYKSLTQPEYQGTFPSVYNMAMSQKLNESLPGNVLIRGVEFNLGGNRYLNPGGIWLRVGWPREN